MIKKVSIFLFLALICDTTFSNSKIYKTELLKQTDITFNQFLSAEDAKSSIINIKKMDRANISDTLFKAFFEEDYTLEKIRPSLRKGVLERLYFTCLNYGYKKLIFMHCNKSSIMKNLNEYYDKNVGKNALIDIYLDDFLLFRQAMQKHKTESELTPQKRMAIEATRNMLDYLRNNPNQKRPQGIESDTSGYANSKENTNTK